MTWCISLKPEYASAIMEGRKKIEVRTRLPKYLSGGDRVFVCVTGTKGKIPFSFKVAWWGMGRPKRTWRLFKKDMCVSLSEFDRYTSGRSWVCLMGIENVQICYHPLSVDELGLKTSPLWFARVSKEV